MGYQLTSLGNLPVKQDVTLYIFIINDNWHGDLYKILERNFSEVAKNIGPSAVIAKGFEEALWSQELCEKYLGKGYESLLDLLPALLLSDQHPDNLADDSLRLLIPLRVLCKIEMDRRG